MTHVDEGVERVVAEPVLVTPVTVSVTEELMENVPDVE